MLVPPTPVPAPPPPGRVYILTKHVDAHIEQKNRDRAKRPPKSWYASSAGKACLRQLWYLRMGFPIERVIKSQYSRDGDAGTRLHEVYQGYLRDLGLLHEDEITVTNDLSIGGRIDGIVEPEFDIEGYFEHEDDWSGIVTGADERIARFVKKGEKGLIEIKSMRSDHFNEMPVHRKWADYVAQMQIYLALRPDLVRGLLYCVCRDDSRTKEFLVERNKPYGDYLLDRIAYLDASLKAAQEEAERQGVELRSLNDYLAFLPVAEPSGLCGYCAFEMRCNGDDMREVA